MKNSTISGGVVSLRSTCRVEARAGANASTISEERPRTVLADPWYAEYAILLRAGFPSEAYELTLSIEADRAWWLSSERAIRPLRSRVTPPFPVGRFVIVESEGRLLKVEFPWGAGMTFEKKSGFVVVRAVLQDHWRCGLRLLGSQKISASGRETQLLFSANRLNALNECLWVEPYRDGARAVVCLTDHSDFDTAEKVRMLADLFGKTGVRVTKGIFPQGDPLPGDSSKQEPGLENAEYRKQIERLYEQGTEIAYHGFGPRSVWPSMEECVRRTKLMEPFSPRTWIDHGSSPNRFVAECRMPDGTDLLEYLSRSGVENFWSYFDLWHNPFRRLSCWSARGSHEVLLDLQASVTRIRGRSWKQYAYLVLHGIKNVYGDENLPQLRRRFSRRNGTPDGMQSRRAGIRSFGAIRRGPMAIYDLDGFHALNDPGRPWVFDTLLLNHLALQLRPAAVDRLARESGLLLGHTYFGCQHDYQAGNCFIGSRHKPVFHPRFVENMEALAARQKSRDVMTMPFSALRRCLHSFSSTRLRRTPQGWRVSNLDGERVTLACASSGASRLVCEKAPMVIRGDVELMEVPAATEVEIAVKPSRLHHGLLATVASTGIELLRHLESAVAWM